jgi:16S rRNA G966 N2-methylase RsmD
MNNKGRKPTLLGEIQKRVRYANRQRWFRLAVSGRGNSVGEGFFDNHPRFFATSTTRAEPDRLNQRYRALIESNADIIAGRQILDLASHDGRWAFAAHRTGAAHVLGIEARDYLVEAAHGNMREYGVLENQVEFVRGDVLTELDRLEPGMFDTVFCFGFLYHTIDHMPLLRKIAHLKPKNLIIDTLISVSAANIIEIKTEKIETESNGVVGEPGNPGSVIIGKPSKSALELMLHAAGFRPVRYYDWLNAGITRWDDLEVYYLGERVSLTSEAVLT